MDDDVAPTGTDTPAEPALDLRLYGGGGSTDKLFVDTGQVTQEVADDVAPPPDWFDAPVTDA